MERSARSRWIARATSRPRPHRRHRRQAPGRVGDSPIVGAGVYADNATCAVSGTGNGEFFLRSVLAFNVAARMLYRGESLARAGGAALAQVARLGGRGGLIAVDRGGRIAMPFNSEGMYRACIDRRGRCMIVTSNVSA